MDVEAVLPIGQSSDFPSDFHRSSTLQRRGFITTRTLAVYDSVSNEGDKKALEAPPRAHNVVQNVCVRLTPSNTLLPLFYH